jgi:antitoxin (DNA-binding transcriptional repressor) of toxin-antitoxin stability system
MIQAPLNQLSEQLLGLLKQAAGEEVLLTQDGRPIGVLIAFEDEDDWFDYQLENDPRFLKRIEQARAEINAGNTVSLDQLKDKLGA